MIVLHCPAHDRPYRYSPRDLLLTTRPAGVWPLVRYPCPCGQVHQDALDAVPYAMGPQFLLAELHRHAVRTVRLREDHELDDPARRPLAGLPLAGDDVEAWLDQLYAGPGVDVIDLLPALFEARVRQAVAAAATLRRRADDAVGRVRQSLGRSFGTRP